MTLLIACIVKTLRTWELFLRAQSTLAVATAVIDHDSIISNVFALPVLQDRTPT